MTPSDRLEELINQYENALYRTALAILGTVPEAEDAVQETFLRYLQTRPKFKDKTHEKAWLLRVTANCCRDVLRDRVRHPTVELLDVYPAPNAETGDLVEAILELPYEQRAAVHLFYYEGYSTGEIGKILGRKAGTVRSDLSRAREALRQKLKGEF